MKTISYSICAIGVLLLSSCNFSVGTKKDFSTGLSYSYNGFSVNRVVLTGAGNMAMTSNEVPINSSMAIVVEGLSNYTLKEGLAYPGVALRVKDTQGNSILDEPDLLRGYTGVSVTDAANLQGTLTVASPMQSGQTYHVNLVVWDKNNPDNKLTADVDIDVK